MSSSIMSSIDFSFLTFSHCSPLTLIFAGAMASLCTYWVMAFCISTVKFQCTWVLFFNHTFLSLPMRMGANYIALTYGVSMNVVSILGIPLVVWAFLRSRVYVEWLNYMWHWYLHKIPFLYKHIHWYHHRPMVDSGWLAEDRHCIEHFVFELIHTVCKMIYLLLPQPLSFMGFIWADMVYAIMTVLVHQDSPSSHPAIIHHQRHHWYITSNFGSTTIWDTKYGTLTKPNYAWEQAQYKIAMTATLKKTIPEKIETGETPKQA